MRRGIAGRRGLVGLVMLIPGLLVLHPGAGRAQPAVAELKAPPKRPVPRKVVTASRPPAVKGPGLCAHVVKRGETLFRIALHHGIKAQALAHANGLTDPRRLRVGQRLSLPGCAAPPPFGTALRAEGRIAASPPPSPEAGRRPRVHPLSREARETVEGAPEFVWPVDGPVLSGFGRRRGGWHAGVDIRAERGAPIRAAAPGVVVFSGWAPSYGNVVKIEHGDGYMSLYAHNLQNMVKVGDEVDTDTVIATVGRTGRASANHVHFEIRRHGVAYDPTPLLDPREAPTLLAGASDVWPPDTLLPVSSLALAPDERGDP